MLITGTGSVREDGRWRVKVELFSTEIRTAISEYLKRHGYDVEVTTIHGPDGVSNMVWSESMAVAPKGEK